MSDVDARLMAALQADSPPAHDVMCRVEVLARLERARFRRRVILTMAVASAAAVLMAASAQAIGAWMATDVRRVWIVTLGAMAAMRFAFVLAGASLITGAPALVDGTHITAHAPIRGVAQPKIFATIPSFPYLLPSTPYPERPASRCGKALMLQIRPEEAECCAGSRRNRRSPPPIRSHGYDATRATREFSMPRS